MKLNLGSGKNRSPGWSNCDKNAGCDPDIVIDLDDPFKCKVIKPDSVEEVKANHILEHLLYPDRFFNWLYDVCKVGAKIHIECPHVRQMIDNPNHFYADPTHRRGYCHETFQFICDPEKAETAGIYGKFKLVTYNGVGLKIKSAHPVCVVDLEVLK